MSSPCACNDSFAVTFALQCPKRRYTHMRHNELRNSIANLLSHVCYDVEIEPHLKLLQIETFALKSTTIDDDVRLDINSNGIWESRFNKT